MPEVAITIYYDNREGRDNVKPIKLRTRERLKSKPGNFLVCPLSVEILLALTLSGAEGNTAKEIANALMLPHNPERIQEAFKELGGYFKGNEEYSLSSTNKIYVRDGLKISKQFKNIAVTSFDADIQNFQDKGQFVSEINKWVAKETNDKMTTVVNEDLLNEHTRIVLLNTVYFKGRLVKEFSRVLAGKRRFFINKSDYTDTTMLESIGYFNYHEHSKLKSKFLEMPYEGHDITATLILPDDKAGLVNVERRIAEFFSKPQYKMESVHVRLPKCRISTAVHFADILQGMGVRDAFTDNANFRGILEVAEPLKIDSVIHKTFIDGEETKVPEIMGTRFLETASNPASLIEPFKFYADHPFVFYLRHRITGVFFIGRLSRVDGAVKTVLPVRSRKKSVTSGTKTKV